MVIRVRLSLGTSPSVETLLEISPLVSDLLERNSLVSDMEEWLAVSAVFDSF
mgnify:CR=1 FL=1